MGGVLDVDVVRGEGRLELRVVEREQRRRGGEIVGGAGRTPAVFIPSGLLKLWEPFEPERLRETNNGARGGVRPPGELLSSLERGLVQMVNDVLGHVLLRARELVEAGA